MHNLGAGRERLHPGGLALGEQVCADADQQIMVLHHVAQCRCHSRHGAGIERMVAWEGGAVGHALHVDRCAHGFGKGDDLGKGVAVRHAIAGKDYRGFGLADQRGCLGDLVRITADAGADAGRLADIEAFRRHRGQHVAGDGKEHRAGRRGQRHFGRPAHGTWQFLDAVYLERPFAQRARHGGQIVPQQRLGQADAHVLLAGCHQHRRTGLGGVVQHAHGIPQARRGVQVAHGQLASGLGPAIGHAHHHHLVQAEHITQPIFDHEGIEQWQLGRAGVAEDDLDTLRMQDIEEQVLAGPRRSHLIAHGIISPSVTGGSRRLPSSSGAPGR